MPLGAGPSATVGVLVEPVPPVWDCVSLGDGVADSSLGLTDGVVAVGDDEFVRELAVSCGAPEHAANPSASAHATLTIIRGIET